MNLPGDNPEAPVAGEGPRAGSAEADDRRDPDHRSRSAPEAFAPQTSRRARNFYHLTGPAEVQARITLYVVRAVFFLAAAGLGYTASQVFAGPGEILVPILTSCGLALAVIVGEVFFSRAPVRTLASILFGLLMGLAISLFFRPVVVLILSSVTPEGGEIEPLVEFLQLVTTTLFCYFGVAVLLHTKDDFKFIIPYVEFRKQTRSLTPLVLDTSVIIDGRVTVLFETNFLDQRIVVPRFVLNELQEIADSSDRSRRERGRRGLDTLSELQRRLGVEVLERDLDSGTEVDFELVKLVEELRGKLLTTDFNLQKRARVQGIPVLNLNDLVAALRPVYVAGETLRVELQRPGEDPGQAVGFLGDGTMVVVENASRQIGREVQVEVTSSTQTQVGKMIFGRLRRGAGRSKGRERRSGRRSS